MWDTRYRADEYVYGTEPNDFLRSVASMIPKGKVLCIAEGEGRNAVYLAQQGYDVTAVDSSSVGLAKAQRLAQTRSVKIETIVADLAEYQIEPHTWQGIVTIFGHLPPAIRADLHRRCVAGLVVGGAFILEAYSPRQLQYDTGGPPVAELLMELSELKHELAGLHFHSAHEIEREVVEGRGHTGLGSVVQILGFSPASTK